MVHQGLVNHIEFPCEAKTSASPSQLFAQGATFLIKGKFVKDKRKSVFTIINAKGVIINQHLVWLVKVIVEYLLEVPL